MATVPSRVSDFVPHISIFENLWLDEPHIDKMCCSQDLRRLLG